ncbi:hypothetical protein HDC94_001152 [Leifsonia sp. AK011]|uniref:glycosyltransferase family 2 protein n=1 Tax=Leifsonia sp. AK011 TaxID=2723075 RepID=UPI0015CD258B|nr:glycosyltransferase family 2 protein [Leifsonia sp. AK011]NYF09996.1 hypothetical protein [Leifsonia sp. AK011]
MTPLSSPAAPMVSVVVAFHDDAARVETALRQLAAIDYPNAEFLLVDDGSTDATPGLLDAFAAERPAVRVLHNPENRGVAASRNRAVAEATGQYLWFADPDDRWDAGMLGQLVAAVDPGADIVVCGARVVDEAGCPVRTIDDVPTRHDLTGLEALEAVLRGELTGYLWNKLVRRGLATPFPIQRSLSDLPFVAAAVSAAAVVRRIPGTPYTYVQRAGSITRAGGGVDLGDLARSALAVIETAGDAPAPLVTLFRYWFAIVPTHTQWALRHERATAMVDGLDVRVRVGEARGILPLDRRTALKALWIRCAGPLFAPIYRALMRGRTP